MKYLLCLALSFIAFNLYSQTIYSVNSGSVSNDNFIYTVGEIFVLSNNSDETNSGIIGAISRIEVLLSGNNEPFGTDASIFPNPTRNAVFIEVENATVIKNALIYDMTGRLLSKKPVDNNQINLSKLPTGTYLVKIPELDQSFKIIKQ